MRPYADILIEAKTEAVKLTKIRLWNNIGAIFSSADAFDTDTLLSSCSEERMLEASKCQANQPYFFYIDRNMNAT
jgi:hypothetical protein